MSASWHARTPLQWHDTQRLSNNAAGPLNSQGYCGGQCCNGTCNYDQKTGTYSCCELLQLHTPHWQSRQCNSLFSSSMLQSAANPRSSLVRCAGTGPFGTAGHCSSECCPAATSVCAQNYDSGAQTCCALLSHTNTSSCVQDHEHSCQNVPVNSLY